MSDQTPTWWDRNKKKVLLGGGIILGGVATVILLGRTEEVEHDVYELEEADILDEPDSATEPEVESEAGETEEEEDDVPMVLG